MLEILNSLTLWSGGFVVGVISLISTYFVHATNNLDRVIYSMIIAFIVTNILYWMPCWLGANCDEFFSWAPLFIVPWIIVGFFVSFIFQLLFKKKE